MRHVVIGDSRFFFGGMMKKQIAFVVFSTALFLAACGKRRPRPKRKR
jgi:hypothetical protein